MPRKVAAKAARETPQARALRLACEAELSVALRELPELTEAEARRFDKREAKFARDADKANEAWASASPEWRAEERRRLGFADALAEADTATLYGYLRAFERESARDTKKATPRPPAVPLVANTPESLVTRPVREKAPAPVAAPQPERKRIKAGVAGVVAIDPRLWDLDN